MSSLTSSFPLTPEDWRLKPVLL